MSNVRLCHADGCSKPAAKRGRNSHLQRKYCCRHERAKYLHGDDFLQFCKPEVDAKEFLSNLVSDPPEGCVHWPKKARSRGYGLIMFRGRQIGAHCASCELFHGPAPTAKHEVAHNCGVRDCVNPKHLRWATRKENMADRLTHGTMIHGEATHNAVLTEKIVRDIRAAHAQNVSNRVIAETFGLPRGTVWGVTKRMTWAHVD